MQYYKHSELANQYHVSLKTVHNWIGAAKEGKMNLQLHETKSGTYVANTSENTVILEEMAEKGKKYRNSLHQKIVQPLAEFYDIYSPRQILDIINNIDVHHEIPRQYNYLKDGASNWDNWLKRLSQDTSSNLLNSSIQLIHSNMEAIDRLLDGYDRVNIIDLGVGNAFPVRELLAHLLKKEVLHRYIAIDISPNMLDIAERNVQEWFDSEVHYEGHVRDMTYERFDDLVAGDMLDKNAGTTINLILLLGATPNNFRSFNDVFTVVYGSMGKNDLLIYTDKLDTETSRRYFDFSADKSSSIQLGMTKLSANHKYILDLMNIDESLYDVEAGFDEEKYMRYIRIRLRAALKIEFKVNGGNHAVQLEKGESILLLRVWHLSALEIITEFEKTGFMLLHSNLTNDRQYFLSISGVETK